MIILRDFDRTEHDDWTLNVLPRLDETTESVKLYALGKVVGWKIQTRGE